MSAVNGQQSAISSFTYELGAAGNRLSVTDLNGRKATYGYDNLYRLTNETIIGDAVTASNGSIGYVYDAVGNRLNRTSSVAAIPSTTSTFDANDRLNSDQYDANGSTTGSGANTYRYDFENHLITLNAGSPNAVSYLYDGDGNRVSKTVGTGGSAVTTKFLVDTMNPTGYAQVVEEIVGGNVQRAYVHGHSLINQTQLLGSPTASWVTSFYGMDGHGSVRFLTNSTGTITDSYTYDAFGNLISSTGTTPNNYLYAGEQLDPNLGFYYLRARYMNASSGRFWTMDSLEGSDFDPVSLHKYTYSAGDPLNKFDRTGLQTEIDIVAIEEVNAVLSAISSATLAAERARQVALAIRVVVALLVGTATLTQKASRVRPPTTSDDRSEVRHAGSLQAQGDDITKEPAKLSQYPDLKYDYRNGEGTVSWSWNESAPLPAVEASRHLQQMADVLSAKQLVRREQAFKEASRFIINAASGGGVQAQFRISFPKDKPKYGVDYQGAPRVDINVDSGLAFVPVP